MTRVFNGERTFLSPVLRPVEAGVYWIGGVDERREQALADLCGRHAVVHVGAFAILYTLMRLQAVLAVQSPRGSRRFPKISPSTRPSSFLTNTNWQNYGGESTMSYLNPDAGVDAPELPVRRNRYRAGGRLDSRLLRSSMRTVGNSGSM